MSLLSNVERFADQAGPAFLLALGLIAATAVAVLQG